MCRHLARIGPPRSLHDVVSTAPHSLVTQSWQPRLQRHGHVNVDGFGVGWYVEGRAEPVRYRRAQPIWTDASFASLAPTISSGCILAAVRSASVGTGHDESCAAPFHHGRWLFSHNGRVADHVLARRELAGLLADIPEAAAPVDSALLFGLTVRHLLEGTSLAGSLAKVMSTMERLGGGRLNLLVTDGEQIAATAWGERLFTLHRGGGDYTVASEPDDDTDGWTEVPQGTLILVDPCGITPTHLGTPTEASAQ